MLESIIAFLRHGPVTLGGTAVTGGRDSRERGFVEERKLR